MGRPIQVLAVSATVGNVSVHRVTDVAPVSIDLFAASDWDYANGQETHSITLGDPGRYLVRTQTSAYQIEVHGDGLATLRRIAGPLRRQKLPETVDEIRRIEIGSRGDWVYTTPIRDLSPWYITSTIQQIIRVGY